VFDLDGTLTRHDTLMPYVGGVLARQPLRATRLLRVAPALCRFAIGRADRGQLKGALIAAVLGGMSRAQLGEWTAQFVPRLITRGLYAGARQALARHRGQGDRLVLMSASTDLYVPAIAAALGFAEVLCTGVEWDGDRLIGRLSTPNRRGPEKARCLEGLRRRHPGAAITAYGNAASDLEHLRLADHAVLVNGTWWARRLAERSGINCLSWR
jgi:phosphatidylglycerophosphatase C